jgi:hypothetical protein
MSEKNFTPVGTIGGTPRKPRVGLAIPAYNMWYPEMGHAALCMAIYSAPMVDLTPAFMRGQDTSQARNNMVRGFQAVRPELDFILWIDADMTFPPDALVRLLNHKAPIAGADYRLRMPPFPRIGMHPNPDDPFAAYVPIPPDAPTSGVDDNMAVLGFGLMLTHMSVYKAYPPPWFLRTWNPKAAREDNPDGFSTEDSVFCTMARLAGIKIACDLDLSKEVCHIGQMSVPWEMKNGRT